MKLKMARNSLFAVMLRSPWWASAAAAAGIVVAAQALLPPRYAPAGALAAVPFAVIALMVGYRQLKRPSAARVDTVSAAVGAMSWPTFCELLHDAFVRDGCQVKRLSGGAADFELLKDGRLALVMGKRWKTARTGIEPLRELAAAKTARGAHEAIYVALGEITQNAAKYAEQQGIRLLGARDLAGLLPRGALKAA